MLQWDNRFYRQTPGSSNPARAGRYLSNVAHWEQLTEEDFEGNPFDVLRKC